MSEPTDVPKADLTFEDLPALVDAYRSYRATMEATDAARATLERVIDGNNRAALASFLATPEQVEFFELQAARFAEMESRKPEVRAELQRKETLSLVDMTESWVLDQGYATLCVDAYRAGNADFGEQVARNAAEMIVGKAMQG